MSGKGSKFSPHVNGAAAAESPRRNASSTNIAKSILEATTDGYGRWRIPSGDINLGEGWLKSLGYSRSHFKTRGSVRGLIHPKDTAAYDSEVEALIGGEAKALQIEIRFRTKSGDYRRFELRGRPTKLGRDGTPVEIGASVRSVPSREQPSDQLHRERLAATLNAARDSIFVVDPVDFRLLLFNKAFEDLVHDSRRVRLQPGMKAEDIAPDRAKDWNKLFRKTLKVGEARLEYIVQSLKAKYQLSAQLLQQGGQVDGICVFGHNITSQRRMEDALRESEEKFFKAFQGGPISLALTSLRDFRYIEVNEKFLEATGWSRGEIIGKTPFDIDLWVRPEQRAEMVQELVSTGSIRNREFLFRTKGGEIRHGFGSATVVEIGEEPCMLGVTYDITDSKQTTNALEESEERLRLAIASGRMYAFEWEPSTDRIKRSKESETILCLSGDRAHHNKQELIEMVDEEDRDQYVRTLKSLSPETPAYRVIFRLHRPDGNMLWLEESGRAFFDSDGLISKVVGMTNDVTEMRESERTLRELSGRLISSQEEERQRIARELHDHIGQEMALLCVQVHRLSSSQTDLESLRSEALRIYKKAKDISTEISKLSHRLHSTELDFLGLTTAAERLCRDFSSQFGVAMDFASMKMPPRMDIQKTRCFYRVLQEALQNIAKHSRASSVRVRLDVNSQCLTMEIQDNGIGFDLDKTRFEAGLGLVSIRERLHLVGGRFTLNSTPGAGTTLVVAVPV